MAFLFSPLRVGSLHLPNRIVRAPVPIEQAWPGGFNPPHVVAQYGAWAAGGVGLILSEPLWIVPPPAGVPGIYADVLIPDVAQLVAAAARYATPLLAVLYHPPVDPAALRDLDLRGIQHLFMQATWRALAAGCAGVVFQGDGQGLLQQLQSPLINQRRDEYGGVQRMHLATDIVASTRRWLGSRLIIGYRLLIDEFRSDGITLHESRVAARQLVAAGANLLDVVANTDSTQAVAHFPGWQIPLAAAIRAVVDVPIIVNGEMGNRDVAESALADECADLIGIGPTLMHTPDWPQRAAQQIANHGPSPLLD